MVNVPMALVIAALAMAVRTPAPTHQEPQRLDAAGAALVAGILAAGVP